MSKNMNPMIVSLLTLFLLSAPIFVYLDATAHNVGKPVGTKRGFLVNWHAGEWAICCMCLGPIGLAAYLFNRRLLITKGLESPVSLSYVHRACVLSLLLVWAGFFAIYGHIRDAGTFSH